MAGKRKGTEDERYLWGEMLRAIQEIKPTYVIAENVFGITNIDGGLVFEQVCLDLENEGYEIQPFVLPAASKNAPHRRDRVWFIATNSNLSGCKNEREQSKSATQNKRIEYSSGRWEQFPTQPPICSGDDGLPTELDGITFSKWRAESIKGYGNAIVPQVAYEIFKQL